MSRRTRLLITIAGVALEVLLVLESHPADAAPWRMAVSVVFAAFGVATFAVVGLTALRDNARSGRMITASRRTQDPYRNDWTHR